MIANRPIENVLKMQCVSKGLLFLFIVYCFYFLAKLNNTKSTFLITKVDIFLLYLFIYLLVCTFMSLCVTIGGFLQ